MLGYKHSRSNLVFRICSSLFLEFSADSLNLPMPSPANLVDVMSNSLRPHENNIVQMRPFSHNDPPLKVYTSTMFSIQNDKQCFILLNFIDWFNQIYLFKEVQ